MENLLNKLKEQIDIDYSDTNIQDSINNILLKAIDLKDHIMFSNNDEKVLIKELFLNMLVLEELLPKASSINIAMNDKGIYAPVKAMPPFQADVEIMRCALNLSNMYLGGTDNIEKRMVEIIYQNYCIIQYLDMIAKYYNTTLKEILEVV